MTRTKPAKGAGEDHPRRALSKSAKIVMTQLRCHLMPGFVERLE
jgi:hypothetical protein